MSDAAIKWGRRLQRVLRDMPADVEVMVMVNEVAVLPKGFRERHSGDQTAAASAAVEEAIFTVCTARVYPNSEYH